MFLWSFGKTVQNLKHQLRGWYMEDIKALIHCCVALHNMTQEVRRDNYNFSDDIEWENGNEMETGEMMESLFLENNNQVGNYAAQAL